MIMMDYIQKKLKKYMEMCKFTLSLLIVIFFIEGKFDICLGFKGILLTLLQRILGVNMFT